MMTKEQIEEAYTDYFDMASAFSKLRNYIDDHKIVANDGISSYIYGTCVVQANTIEKLFCDLAVALMQMRDEDRKKLNAVCTADVYAPPPSCTCHLDDNPPVPCQKKGALTDCFSAEMLEGFPNIAKAFALIQADNSHDFNPVIPSRWHYVLPVIDGALGSLTPHELADFCCSADDEAARIMLNGVSGLLLANVFLDDFFHGW